MSRQREEALSQCLDETLTVCQSLERLVRTWPESAGELQDVLRLAHRLKTWSIDQPAAGFRRDARERFLSLLPAVPATVTIVDRFLASTADLRVLRRMEMKWWVIAAMALSALGGGAGVAYAADGAVPEQALYGLDRALEQVQVRLAALAAGGGADREQPVADLVGTAKAIHTQVLTDVLGRVPDQAQESVQQAIANSQGGAQGGPPEDALLPEGEALSFEERIAGLERRLTQTQLHISAGDLTSARIELLAFDHEVKTLAQELAGLAQADEARAQALAALLDEALMQHEPLLAQLMSQAPARAAG